jgi:hypothetical protein
VAPRTPAFPKSYVNRPLRSALEAFTAGPDNDTLAAFFAAIREGGLVLDITGTTSPADPRVRTLLSTDGAPVLPVFTSVDELRLALPEEERAGAQAMILPAREALALVESADCVAVQFDVGSIAQVVKRDYVLAEL